LDTKEVYLKKSIKAFKQEVRLKTQQLLVKITCNIGACLLQASCIFNYALPKK